MRTTIIALTAALALAGCSSVATPDAAESDPLPLVAETTVPAASDDTAATEAEPSLEDLSAASDIDPDVLAAMIVIVAGGDVDGAIDAGEFDEVDVLEALDLLAGAQN